MPLIDNLPLPQSSPGRGSAALGRRGMKRRRLILMATIVLVMVTAILSWLWWLRPAYVGDLGFRDSGLVGRYDTVPFDPQEWRRADERGRGRMVADLMRRNRFVGFQSRAVDELLGSSTCYYDYEDEPCYRVEYDGQRFNLAFGVNHSNRLGEVTHVSLVR